MFDPTKPYKFRNSIHKPKIVYISPFDEKYPITSTGEDCEAKLSFTVHHMKDGRRGEYQYDDYDLINLEDYSEEIEFLELLEPFSCASVIDMRPKLDKIISILKGKKDV